MIDQHHDRVEWIWNGTRGTGSRGSLILNSRELSCYAEDTPGGGLVLAWQRSFRTRAQARSCYEGDLRAMRKNVCYRWVNDPAPSETE